MRPFHGMSATRAKAHKPEKPYGWPMKTRESNLTVELVEVSPDTFLRLEGKRRPRKNKITLAPVKFGA